LHGKQQWWARYWAGDVGGERRERSPRLCDPERGVSRRDPSIFRPFLEEYWDQNVVLEPAGVLPDSTPRPHKGWDGVLAFFGNQMEAFSEGWLEATEFIDRGDYLIVPYRFGGRARHTGLPVEFSFVALFSLQDGKVTRLEVHRTKADALEAAGLEE
jgi:ketosteroid isomerase-like protein